MANRKPIRYSKKRYLNKYRSDTKRLKGWDYSASGYYFITIITSHRHRYLGEIRNGRMILSSIGKIVDYEWKKSFEIRNELILDEYVIMPDHLHAIVIISPNDRYEDANDHSHPQFTMKPKSISSFIAGFKSGVTIAVDNLIDEKNLKISKFNRQNHFFQKDYYDRIIWNKQQYLLIKRYIKNNPSKWKG